MQLAAETIARYTRDAPELLDAVTSGETAFVMRRDPATDLCVKFDQGLCGIHTQYGEDFLGDACFSYPRITRALGMTVMTTAALSCPEAARLMLSTKDGFVPTVRAELRTPYVLKNNLPEGITDAQALAIHEAFLAMAADSTVTPERSLMRISAVARALMMQPVTAWPEAVALYSTMADGRIPAAEPAAADLFNLLHALQGLARASTHPSSPVFDEIDAIAQLLDVSFATSGAMVLGDNAAAGGVRALARMRAQSSGLAPVLRRYLAAQLSEALFPFAGFGATLAERMTIIGVRVATLKLALATLPENPSAEEVVRIVYRLARVLDHLADPALSLTIYEETGWTREARLRGLVDG